MSDLVQSYNFETGELTSRFRYQTRTASADGTVLTFAGRSAPTLLLQ